MDNTTTVVVEEKHTNKETGEVTLKKYIKGKFLGKVIYYYFNKMHYREGSHTGRILKRVVL